MDPITRPPSPDDQRPRPFPSSDRTNRVATGFAVGFAFIGWTGLVVVSTLVVGFLWGYSECPNVGPGIYLGSPEPNCAADHLHRTIGPAALVWTAPLAVGLLAQVARRTDVGRNPTSDESLDARPARQSEG